MNKKLTIISLTLLIFIVLSILYYSFTYDTIDNKKQIEDKIKELTSYNNINIEQEINVDNKKYILYSVQSIIGYVEFTKGFNNRFKVESGSSGTNSIICLIISTNKSRYLLIGGKNYNKEIANIAFSIDENEYKIPIEEEKFFLTCSDVSKNIEISNYDKYKVKFYEMNYYDKNGNDITKATLENY